MKRMMPLVSSDLLSAEAYSPLFGSPLVLLAPGEPLPAGGVKVLLDREGLLPEVDPADYDALVTSRSAAPRPWVSVSRERIDGQVEVAQATAALAPVATAMLARVLRLGEGLTFDAALELESLAYSALLGGNEFARWLGASVRPDEGEQAANPVHYERDGDQVKLTLASPGNHNAMTAPMRDALYEALVNVWEDPSLPHLTLGSEGKCFSTGGSLAEFGTAHDLAQVHVIRTQRSATRILHLLSDRATVRLHGACIGSGKAAGLARSDCAAARTRDGADSRRRRHGFACPFDRASPVAVARAWGVPDRGGPGAGLGPDPRDRTMIERLHQVLAPRLAGFDLEPTVLLERDAPGGLDSPGIVSANSHCRLLRTADGWVALNLARAEDRELVPALTGMVGDPWLALADLANDLTSAEFRDRAAELQLPVTVLGESASQTLAPVGLIRVPGKVVDLSALWAGPLCAGLLARAGAEVVRIESLGRPDPTPQASPLLDARINGGKARRAVDLRAEEGRAELQKLIGDADVLVTSARPAALARLGLEPAKFPNLTWVAITAHGFFGPGAGRVGFGDDCAVAGGLVSREAGEPRFLGDALADPLTGLEAALAVLAGQRGLIDAAMARVAASYAVKLA
jgi:CoA-transferase family III